MLRVLDSMKMLRIAYGETHLVLSLIDTICLLATDWLGYVARKYYQRKTRRRRKAAVVIQRGEFTEDKKLFISSLSAYLTIMAVFEIQGFPILTQSRLARLSGRPLHSQAFVCSLHLWFWRWLCSGCHSLTTFFLRTTLVRRRIELHRGLIFPSSNHFHTFGDRWILIGCHHCVRLLLLGGFTAVQETTALKLLTWFISLTCQTCLHCLSVVRAFLARRRYQRLLHRSHKSATKIQAGKIWN